MEREDLRSGNIVTLLCMVGNALLVAFKIALGILGRSQALIADAVHSVSDFITDFFALAGLQYANKSADHDHPFGHGKIETLMSLLIGIAVLLTGLGIGYNAFGALLGGDFPKPTYIALIGALASILTKEVMYQYTVRVGRRIGSQVLVANAWHHRSDAISSIAAAIGIGVAVVYPDWAFMDAVAALVVAVFILKVGHDIVVPAFRAASDASPDAETIGEISAAAMSVEGVRSVHDLKARYYANKIYVEVHVVVDPGITVRHGHAIANAARESIFTGVEDILDVIVHVDPDRSES